MKIEITGKDSERVKPFLSTTMGVKFVISEEISERVALLFYAMNEHIDMVRDPSKFLGAGRVGNNGETIYYGSQSCSERLGRDRPADPAVAEAVLIELKTAVQEMVKE